MAWQDGGVVGDVAGRRARREGDGRRICRHLNRDEQPSRHVEALEDSVMRDGGAIGAHNERTHT